MSHPYPWIKDSTYLTPSVTGYLAVTSPNGLYLTNGVTQATIITPTSVTSETFNGAFSGTATSAATVTIAEDNTNTTFYPVFVSNNTGNLALKVDKTTNPLSYNPNTGTLIGQVFSPGNGGSVFSALTTTGLEVTNGSSAQTFINSGQITCKTTATNPPTTTITPTFITCVAANAASTTKIDPISVTAGSGTSTFSQLQNTGLNVVNAGSNTTTINSGQIICSQVSGGSQTTITPTSVTSTTFNGALSGNATTATTATRATNIAGGFASQIPYQSGSNTTSFIANGPGGQVLQSNGAAAPSWSSRFTFTEQLTLPTSRPTASLNTGILTCSFDNKSTGIFIATLTADMTGVSFTNGRIGGQYVIYISANGGTRTIAATLTPIATTKTNYTRAINVLMSSVALLTITFDGQNYLIAGSAFNSTQVQALTDAVFEYSPDGVSWFTIPSGGTNVTYDGNSYQFRVFSVSPSGATYSSSIPLPISQQGETAQLSVTGTGSYTGTITSGIFIIQQRTLLAYYAPGGSSPIAADSCVLDGRVAEFNFRLENLVGFDTGVSVNIIYGTLYNQSSGEIRQPAPVGGSSFVGHVNDQYGSGNNFIVTTTTTSNVAVYCNENEDFNGKYWWIVINPYRWEDDTGFIFDNLAYNKNYTSPIVSVSGSNAFFDNNCV